MTTVALPAGFDIALLNRDVAASGSAATPTVVQGEAAARDAAESFEAQFLAQMLGHMFTGISTDGPFGGGRSEEIWRSQMIDQYGQLIARSGGVGIADHVLAEILRVQEVTDDNSL